VSASNKKPTPTELTRDAHKNRRVVNTVNRPTRNTPCHDRNEAGECLAQELLLAMSGGGPATLPGHRLKRTSPLTRRVEPRGGYGYLPLDTDFLHVRWLALHSFSASRGRGNLRGHPEVRVKGGKGGASWITSVVSADLVAALSRRRGVRRSQAIQRANKGT
jgi:hypothetical protein